MLEFYRRCGAAFLVLAFVAAASLGAKYANQESDEPGARQECAEQNCDVTAKPLEPAIVGLFPPSNSIEASYDSAKTAEYDLQAQRWMAWFTGVIAFLTFLGIGLIAATLRETGKVLTETRNTTRAAERNVSEVKRIGEAQLRAYVGVEQIVAEGLVVGAVPKFKVRIKNFGVSPATHFKIAARTTTTDERDPDTKKFPFIDAPVNTDGVVYPQQAFDIVVDWEGQMPRETLSEIVTGQTQVILGGWLSYRDFTGRQRRAIFRSVLNPERIRQGTCMLTVCRRQNRAN